MVEQKIILEKYVIFGKNNYWTCRLCQHRSNGRPNRIIAHLTCNPGKGIKICPKISPEKMEELKRELGLGPQSTDADGQQPQQHGEKDDIRHEEMNKKGKATIHSVTSGIDRGKAEMSLLGASNSSSALGESISISGGNIWSFQNLEKSVGATGSPLDNQEQNFLNSAFLFSQPEDNLEVNRLISGFYISSLQPENLDAPIMPLPETSYDREGAYVPNPNKDGFQETNAVGCSELFNVLHLAQSSSQGPVDHRNDQHTHPYASTRENAHGFEMTSEIVVADEPPSGFHPCSGSFERGVEEDEKRKARLMRNCESAQLSRLRKKHRVEELEEKVRNIHSTIADLNSKISYLMAENVSLRQQLGGGGWSVMCAPPLRINPPPPMARMAYPSVPCDPYDTESQGHSGISAVGFCNGLNVPCDPYDTESQGHSGISAVRLRILCYDGPFLVTKKLERKKSEGKYKMVARVRFLGLLPSVMLFGGLVPILNVKFGGIGGRIYGGLGFFKDGLNDYHRGRVLSVQGHWNGSHDMERADNGRIFGCKNELSCDRRYSRESDSKPVRGSGGFAPTGNSSEPLVASLLVPRNDKLVKIAGNLSDHSVLAGEKAKASHADPEIKDRRRDEMGTLQNLASNISYNKTFQQK